MVVFVRHFGCLFCQQQVMKLEEQRQTFADIGVDLVVIGNGAPTFIEGFRERARYSGVLYTDPQRAAYQALSLRRDLKSSLNVRTIGRALSAFVSGARQVSVQGDAWQQGGIVIVLPSGEIVYRYASEYAGDHPPVGDLLAAAREAVHR